MLLICYRARRIYARKSIYAAIKSRPRLLPIIFRRLSRFAILGLLNWKTRVGRSRAAAPPQPPPPPFTAHLKDNLVIVYGDTRYIGVNVREAASLGQSQLNSETSLGTDPSRNQSQIECARIHAPSSLPLHFMCHHQPQVGVFPAAFSWRNYSISFHNWSINPSESRRAKLKAGVASPFLPSPCSRAPFIWKFLAIVNAPLKPPSFLPSFLPPDRRALETRADL